MDSFVLIASGNKHKISKIKDMFKSTGVKIKSLDEAGIELDVQENGATFEENAVIKAVETSKHHDGLVVATDGGMTIPALEGWNSLFTRRFAGKDVDDFQRMDKILELMKGKAGAQRQMQWKESIAVAKQGECLFSMTVDGICGVMDTKYDKQKYREGIWLCSLWLFPEFDNKNFFDLSETEVAEAEKSWTQLGKGLIAYLQNHELLPEKK